MSKKQKLELSWVGKEDRPRLEPRILIEDAERSYHAIKRVGEADIFDNMLIHGDNLLALKALEAEYAGEVKCIYIDPPFNTGAAFEHYDDGVEHSIWLQLMGMRLESLKRLLSDDGAIFVHLDDNESHYAKILLDEIFGRSNYVNEIIVSTNKPFGFKGTSDALFKQANHVLFYAKNKSKILLNPEALLIEKGYDPQYKWIFEDISKPEAEWTWRSLAEATAEHLGFSGPREARASIGEQFDGELFLFATQNSERVFRTASVSGGALAKRRATIEKSRSIKGRIVRHPNDDMDYRFIGGERVLFYRERLQEIDGALLPVEVVTDIWADIPVEGLASEGGVDFPKGKKPEKLLRRVIEMTTRPGDLVLDSFAGSGTTAAVAHKLRRRWIAIELGQHADTHILPRLHAVVDGTDQSGISKSVDWSGGGGFHYYELAPSLLQKDEWGRDVISKKYNAETLAQALCKLEGFVYAPSPDIYWQHGRSSEADFLYVTTQTLGQNELAALSDEVGEGRSLLVLCSAFRGNADQWPNLTVRKIPNHIRARCEWGRDDYSLNVANLPLNEADAAPRNTQTGLFDDGDRA